MSMPVHVYIYIYIYTYVCMNISGPSHLYLRLSVAPTSPYIDQKLSILDLMRRKMLTRPRLQSGGIQTLRYWKRKEARSQRSRT